jgi:hypothetical protein
MKLKRAGSQPSQNRAWWTEHLSADVDRCGGAIGLVQLGSRTCLHGRESATAR